MSDHASRLALKARLKRTWTPFFERHGNFTAIQLAAIPAILNGQNVVISAPTAQGKTEAAIVPLAERFRPNMGLTILYLTPTRALANDLLARLESPFQSLGVSLAIKTRDLNTFEPEHPPYTLITTPESVDSLLTSQARVFVDLRAIVLDELHLFDGTPRGDQLRVLLNRIRRIRAYAFSQMQISDATLQYVALSATLPDPTAAARYFPVDQVIHVTGQRPLEAELIAMQPDTADALRNYLYTFRARGWHKALIFCNSRAEVESYAAAIRQNSPFGGAVYVHYSNLVPARRRAIEEQFSRAEVAICCATSTLELGIDIGTIDVVLLIGPPGNEASFVQRIGRGNRRHPVSRVTCFYRSPLEKLMFETLCAPVLDDIAPPALPFRPSVAIQQIFSLLKQSPTGSVRLSELALLFETMLSPADLASILGELQTLRYLQPGRPGEWKPGPALNTLFDLQASQTNDLSIYSNIQTSDAHHLEIRDQHTGQPMARVDSRWLNRPILTLEGQTINVEWVDGEAIWITTVRSEGGSVQQSYRSAQKHLSYDLARRLPLQLGFAPGTVPLFLTPEGWWFHWLGDVYGRVLAGLLSYRFRVEETAQPGLCVRLTEADSFTLPVWTFEQVRRYLDDHYQSLERLLDLGPFHHLLPVALRRRAVMEQFNISQFLTTVKNLRPIRDLDGSSLLDLLLK